MMTFERHVIGALVRHGNLPPGALGKPFYEIPADAGYAQQVAQWHQGLPAQAKLSPEALKVLAAPDLVADIRSLSGRDSLLRTWALGRLDCSPGPVLLIAPSGETAKELRVESIATREILADTMLLWLVSTGEPTEPEMKVEMTHCEFAVLLAFVDLYSRAKYSAYIAHRPEERSFSHSFVIQAYDEAVNLNDPRWLLSFTLPMLDEATARVDPAAIWQGIQGLAKRGLVEAAGNEWRFTLPGEFLAESLHRRTVSLAVETVAADPDSTLGTHAAMLVRCDAPMWFFDMPPGGKITLCGVSVQAAREILDRLLTPIGNAPAARPASSKQPGAVAPRPGAPPVPVAHAPRAVPPSPQTRPPAPPPGVAASPAQGAARCGHCGQAVAPGTTFCGNCGGRLR